MRNKSLLYLGLGAGAVALVAFILGWLLYWPDETRGPYDRYGYGGYGPGGMMGGGMMGGYGPGGMMGGGMMGGYGMGYGGMMYGPNETSAAPLSINQARDAAGRYLDYWGDSDLRISEVIEFTNGFYAVVIEQGSGAGAYELIVDRNSGVVYPEPGPNMMWNTKYGVWSEDGGFGMMNGGRGMMDGGSGMMGRRWGGSDDRRPSVTTDMPISGEEARGRAQDFLDTQFPGSRAEDPDTFYGYYTIEFEKDGRLLGMLSVDGYYGQIWYHSWHGAFLAEKQF